LTEQDESELDEREHEKDVARSEVETLILVTGLVMMPFVYLWQQTLTILDEYLPVWKDYLASQLGSHYTVATVIGSYLTPFALGKALPIDLVILAYDATFVLSVVVVLIFGKALIAIEKQDVQRVETIVQKGTTCLNVVLGAIIFFAILHLLTTLFFPFRLMLGLETGQSAPDVWITLSIALATAIIVMKLVIGRIDELLGIGVHLKKPKTPTTRDSKNLSGHDI
jgi:hypothetical protein